MKQRGRPSGAALAIASHAGEITQEIRPDAPYELSDEESDIWRGVVNRMPAAWFGAETFPLLTQYCRHVVRSHRVGQLVQQAEHNSDALDLDRYEKLLKMQQRESAIICTLATKMRIAQQSTIDKEAKKAKVGMKPWQG